MVYFYRFFCWDNIDYVIYFIVKVIVILLSYDYKYLLGWVFLSVIVIKFWK